MTAAKYTHTPTHLNLVYTAVWNVCVCVCVLTLLLLYEIKWGWRGIEGNLKEQLFLCERSSSYNGRVREGGRWVSQKFTSLINQICRARGKSVCVKPTSSLTDSPTQNLPSMTPSIHQSWIAPLWLHWNKLFYMLLWPGLDTHYLCI